MRLLRALLLPHLAVLVAVDALVWFVIVLRTVELCASNAASFSSSSPRSSGSKPSPRTPPKPSPRTPPRWLRSIIYATRVLQFYDKCHPVAKQR